MYMITDCLLSCRCDLHALYEQDLFVRAQKVLKMAEGVRCNKYLTAHELVKVMQSHNFYSMNFHLIWYKFSFRDINLTKQKGGVTESV